MPNFDSTGILQKEPLKEILTTKKSPQFHELEYKINKYFFENSSESDEEEYEGEEDKKYDKLEHLKRRLKNELNFGTTKFLIEEIFKNIKSEELDVTIKPLNNKRSYGEYIGYYDHEIKIKIGKITITVEHAYNESEMSWSIDKIKDIKIEEDIDITEEIKGSIKVNHYIPGTRIPILPEADLYAKDNQDMLILNLAWHLPNEVRQNLSKNNYTGDVVDIKAFFGEG